MMLRYFNGESSFNLEQFRCWRFIWDDFPVTTGEFELRTP